MDHERRRWTGGDWAWQQPPDAALPQQLHLVSQGYPVRIRRALVAGGLALALAVGGALAASVGDGGSVPTSEQSDAVVTTVGLGS